ncbi:polysaccharide biosynthesis tyrosine autokinase [Microbacterium sp. NPDC056234]|uniref:polysaccharide biosynthesis tyrosine autokinase n=1 Tax=Microbacterium sp. NPDC056234 TaxID=3345757 RepID=UPI0035D5F383
MKAEGSGWTLAAAWAAIRKSWYLIVGLTILGGVVGYGISATTTPLYQSTATLYFAMNQGTTGSDLNQGSSYTQSQMLSFAQLATSSRVLSEVIDDLELDVTPRELSRSISIAIPQDTAILDVQVTWPDPELAADIANGVSVELTEVLQDVVAKGPDGAATITADVIDEAVVPQFQALPNKTRDAGLAAILGFVVGVLAAFVVSLADTRIRNEASLARVTDLPYLGSITRVKSDGPAGLVVARDPHSHIAEDFRRVQSALAFANVDGTARRLLVTSASPGDGKSTFAANLAVTLAELGENTLLIDADLRRPRAGELFGLDSSVGLTSAVSGSVALEDAVIRWRESGPDLLLSGSVPPNSASILTSRAFQELLDKATDGYGVVVIDSPPVLTVADTNLIAPLVDGVLIVVDAAKTSRAQLAATIRTLEGAGARITGIVLNRVRLGRDRQSYYTEPSKKKN